MALPGATSREARRIGRDVWNVGLVSGLPHASQDAKRQTKTGKTCVKSAPAECFAPSVHRRHAPATVSESGLAVPEPMRGGAGLASKLRRRASRTAGPSRRPSIYGRPNGRCHTPARPDLQGASPFRHPVGRNALPRTTGISTTGATAMVRFLITSTAISVENYRRTFRVSRRPKAGSSASGESWCVAGA